MIDPVGFFKGLWAQRTVVRLWMGVLLVVHGLGPLAFLGRQGGKAMLAGFVAGVLVMMLLHARSGFTRLLGLAHVAWVPALWIISREVQAFPYGAFFLWGNIALWTGGITLLLDGRDLLLYLRGDREPVRSADDSGA